MAKSSILSHLGLATVLVTILVGPFFQGYFFPNPTLVAMTAVSIGFVLWAVGERMQGRGLNLIQDWTGKLLLGLTVWVLLSSAWAVYVRDNITLLFQCVTALFVFSMVRSENSETVRRVFVWALSLCAFVVAVLGLLEYGGFFMEHTALGNLLGIEPQGIRIFTVFQYPNSAAIFFMVTLLVQNARLVSSQSWVEQAVLGAISGVIASAFGLTLSRGAFIVAPVATLLLWMGLPRHAILPSAAHFFGGAVLPAALSAFPMAQAAVTDDWQRVVLGALAAAVVGMVATSLLHAVRRLSTQLQRAIAAGFLIVVAVGGALAVPRTISDVPNVFQRVTSMSVEDLINSARFEYLRDAYRLVARRPWGYGGGGWLRTYTQVQQYNYVARDPHNHYALIGVEAGIPGLVFLLGSMGLAAWSAFRIRSGDTTQWGTTVAALAIAAHAAIDIDLSYYMMWLLLWTLLGLGQAEQEPLSIKQETRFTLPVTVPTALVVAVTSGCFAFAALSYDKATVKVMLGDNDSAVRLGQRAIALDPLNSQFRTLIPSAANIRRALELDPENQELWLLVAHLREANGDIPGAIAALQRALELRPKSVNLYEQVATLLAAQMTTTLLNSGLEDASAYAKELVSLEQAVIAHAPPNLERQKHVFRNYPNLTMTPPLNLAVGQASLVLGDYSTAYVKLTGALESDDTADKAALWLHALYTRTSDWGALEGLSPQPQQQDLESRLYQVLLRLP